jgi:hypothetical protein
MSTTTHRFTAEQRKDYANALVTMRDLLDDGVDHDGYSEYVRGGVNLMADLFAVPDVETSERMEQIMDDLRQLDWGMPYEALYITSDTLRLHHIDLAGQYNPKFSGKIEDRFTYNFHGFDPDDEPEWRFKIEVTDKMWLDSDGLPSTAIAGGDTYAHAMARAGGMIEEAMNSNTSTFS